MSDTVHDNQPVIYDIGPLTYGLIFRANGITDVSDLQKVLNAVESTLEGQQRFNQLTPAEDERLTMLKEECSEIIHIACKIGRHGYESYHPLDPEMTKNRELLRREVCQLIAVASEMGHRGDFQLEDADGPYSERASKLWESKLQYTHHQK